MKQSRKTVIFFQNQKYLKILQLVYQKIEVQRI